MLDIYIFHDTPEKLDGYHDQWMQGGDKLVQYLLRHPKHEAAMKKLLSSKEDLLSYVKITKKSLDGAVEALAGDTFKLIQYSEILQWRNPDLEEELLHSRNLIDIMLYRNKVMNGNWPESESLVPRDMDWTLKVIKGFTDSLQTINKFRVEEEEDEPLEYQIVINHNWLDVREDNKVIGKITNDGRYYTLYNRDNIVDYVSDTHIESGKLIEYIHILSGVW